MRSSRPFVSEYAERLAQLMLTSLRVKSKLKIYRMGKRHARSAFPEINHCSMYDTMRLRLACGSELYKNPAVND